MNPEPSNSNGSHFRQSQVNFWGIERIQASAITNKVIEMLREESLAYDRNITRTASEWARADELLEIDLRTRNQLEQLTCELFCLGELYRLPLSDLFQLTGIELARYFQSNPGFRSVIDPFSRVMQLKPDGDLATLIADVEGLMKSLGIVFGRSGDRPDDLEIRAVRLLQSCDELLTNRGELSLLTRVNLYRSLNTLAIGVSAGCWSPEYEWRCESAYDLRRIDGASVARLMNDLFDAIDAPSKLEGAKLEGAKLEGAKLEGAQLETTSLPKHCSWHQLVSPLPVHQEVAVQRIHGVLIGENVAVFSLSDVNPHRIASGWCPISYAASSVPLELAKRLLWYVSETLLPELQKQSSEQVVFQIRDIRTIIGEASNTESELSDCDSAQVSFICAPFGRGEPIMAIFRFGPEGSLDNCNGDFATEFGRTGNSTSAIKMLCKVLADYLVSTNISEDLRLESELAALRGSAAPSPLFPTTSRFTRSDMQSPGDLRWRGSWWPPEDGTDGDPGTLN